MTENDSEMTTPQELIPVQASEPIAPATPLPAAVATTEKDKKVRNYVLAAVSGVVAVLLLLGAGVIGYAIGQHDDDNYRGGELAVSADRGGPQGEGYAEGYDDRPMMQGNGIQDFLNQLQGGEGLTPDQQQFLDQLKGFVEGMRNQMG